MNIIKPRKLNKGDTIGIISLSGCIRNEENIYNAKKYFENRGYNVVLSENIFDKKRYLAGEDDTKVQQLKEFFESPDINAILCARGGYGAIRIINKIDYKSIKNNPKIFAGYSDITALSAMILKKTGLITFSSPMAKGDFGSEKVSRITSSNFFKTLSKNGICEIEPQSAKVYKSGCADGILFGGNLATITSLCGIDFIPDEKFIFFAEDLMEDTYKIDKMFTQLLNIPKFRENLSGIILGDFLDVKNKKNLEELFEEIAHNIKKPVIGGYRITHGKHKITVPIGVMAHLDTSSGKVLLNEYLS